MKDQNGLRLRVGDEVVYCDDLFQIAGEYDGRAIIWPIDPQIQGELLIEPQLLVSMRAPLLRDFWRWVKSAVHIGHVPEPSPQRATITA